jgi:thymidylate synthase (FAD)
MTEIRATLLNSMGSDLTVSNAARVSFGKNRKEFLNKGDPRVRPSGRSDEELIQDMAREGHISPFGHCFASFHVKAPIFVARQLVKHKFLRWNEISRRYVDSEPEFYVPKQWRGKSKDKKQGSAGTVTFYPEDHLQVDRAEREALASYKTLLASGVAPEMARMVLPQSMFTEWWWSGSLDAFADMCKLRLKEDTQYESRLVAQQISEEMERLYPVSWKALVKGK